VEVEVEGFKEGPVGADVEAIDELVLIDIKPDKLRNEMLDLQYAVAFLPHTKIHTSVDYAVTVGSDLCIVTAIGIPSILLGPNTQRNETGWG
jgi:malate/lactate dehydrogenase